MFGEKLLIALATLGRAMLMAVIIYVIGIIQTGKGGDF